MRSYFLAALSTVSMAGTADYTSNGADWPDLCQTGREQSPIDFNMVTMDSKLSIDLSGYENFAAGNMTDKGATLQFDTLADNDGARMTLVRANGQTTEW